MPSRPRRFHQPREWDSGYHAPALVAPVVELLAAAPLVLDGTLGGGGHSAALLDAGVRRTIGTAQVGKPPALVADLRKMLERLLGTRVGLRDRALLLVGFAGTFRRSELVSVDLGDVEFSSAGLIPNAWRSRSCPSRPCPSRSAS